MAAFKRFLFFFVLSFFVWQIAQGDNFDIYVYNKPLHSGVMIQNGTLYLPLEDLAKSLKLNIAKGKESIVVGTAPDPAVKGNVIVNGKPFPGAISNKNGVLYVPLKSFVEATGNKVLYNKETKIIDILPGDSLLSDRVAENLEKTTVFPETQSAQSGNSTTGNSPQEQNENLAQEMEALKEKYEKSLEANAGFVEYITELEKWEIRSNTILSQYKTKLDQAKSIQDNTQRLTEMADLTEKTHDQIAANYQIFYQIVPPKEFQNSHAALKQLVDHDSAALPILLQMSQLMLDARGANPEKAYDILTKLQQLMQQDQQILATEKQDSSLYIKAFQSDLEHLNH